MKRLLTTMMFILLPVIVTGQDNYTAFFDVTYAVSDDHDLQLDLYLPVNNPNPNLVVWIHGGAWHSGSRENPPLQLIEKGYALASVSYRLSIVEPFPAQIHDIKAAIRFLRAHADQYGYQGEHIAIWGSSAGGHLVALTGTTNNDPELEGSLGDYTDFSSSVQAVINFFGPSNFLTILDQSTPHGLSVRQPALALLLGQPVDQAPDLARQASPVYHIESSDPPMLIMHGDQDIQVPINQSLEMQGRYERFGLDMNLVIVHGAGHGSPDYFTPDYIDLLDEFLNRVLTVQ